MPTTRQLALGVVGSIISSLDKQFLGFSDVVDAFVEASGQAQQQLKDFEKFDFAPKFKTRVISVPKAIEGFQDLWDLIRNRLLDKFTTIVDETKGVIDGLKHLPARAPGEPLLQHTALILSIVHAYNEQLAKLIHDILDFTQTIDDLKMRIETLDDLFLPQSNPRQLVHLTDSEKALRIRVGSLHSAGL